MFLMRIPLMLIGTLLIPTQATKSVFHATINGYSSYYGCNHMVTVRITAVTIWLQTVVRL